MNVFTQRLRLAADYMAEHGWTQGTERDGNGCICMTGAIRYCSPQTGDEYLIRAVLRHRGRAENWNDQGDRTEEDVLIVLRTAEVTDVDLEEVFGPQWREIVTLVRQAATLTPDQADWLDAARDAAWSAAWSAARDAARDAARSAAWSAARDAARSAAWSAARSAARSAVSAMVVRDLISEEHFDVLYGPWAAVFGAPVPCDL